MASVQIRALVPGHISQEIRAEAERRGTPEAEIIREWLSAGYESHHRQRLKNQAQPWITAATTALIGLSAIAPIL